MSPATIYTDNNTDRCCFCLPVSTISTLDYMTTALIFIPKANTPSNFYSADHITRPQ